VMHTCSKPKMAVLARPGACPVSGRLRASVLPVLGGQAACRRPCPPLNCTRRVRAQVCVLGLLAMLSCPAEALPPEVASSEALIVAGVAKLLVGLKEQEVRVRCGDVCTPGEGSAWVLRTAAVVSLRLRRCGLPCWPWRNGSAGLLRARPGIWWAAFCMYVPPLHMQLWVGAANGLLPL